MNRPAKYLFVDGAFFQGVCEHFASNIFPDASFENMVNFSALMHDCSRAFYYDCLPSKRGNMTEEEHASIISTKQRFFDTLKMVPNMHVREGISRYRKTIGTEQKGVDILLAIEAYQHAVNGSMDTSVIITGDLDFYPLFDALVQTRVRTELYYDPRFTSRELIHAADIAVASDHMVEEANGVHRDKEFLLFRDTSRNLYTEWSEADQIAYNAPSKFAVLNLFYRDPDAKVELFTE